METKVFFNLLSQRVIYTCIAEQKREVLPFTATSIKYITLVRVIKDGIK